MWTALVGVVEDAPDHPHPDVLRRADALRLWLLDDLLLFLDGDFLFVLGLLRRLLVALLGGFRFAFFLVGFFLVVVFFCFRGFFFALPGLSGVELVPQFPTVPDTCHATSPTPGGYSSRVPNGVPD